MKLENWEKYVSEITDMKHDQNLQQDKETDGLKQTDNRQ